MQTFKTILTLIFFVSITAVAAMAGNAKLQVIHNAADPGAEVVDIYVNGDLFLDNFGFREATPFVDVPSDVELQIGVAPGNSGSADDIIATFNVTLMDGRNYVAVANGVLDPGSFGANPDGLSIAFTLFTTDNIRLDAPDHRVNVIAFHGATDAPTVDVRARGRFFNWTMFDNLQYGEFSWYRKLHPKTYILDVTPGNDNSTVVASYEADLSGLAGGSAIVFASGFLNPANNMDGAGFGLFAALTTGDVIELPLYEETARLQVIHNSADPAAEMVDIYVNGALFLNDFAFRAATPFVSVPAGVELNIGIAPSTSMSVDDIIANIPVTLAPNGSYVAIANGVLNPDDFVDNPDGRSIGFQLFAKDGARERALWGALVDLLVFHGSTDAPTVDVLVKDRHFALVNDLAYGDFAGYKKVLPASYVLEITPGNDNSTVVAAFEADLSGLNGGAAVVFASGFLSPGDNMNGAAFGLFAALPDGTVIELPPVAKEARLQVIHNAADPAAEVVDIYVNGSLFLDNFGFREATPFVSVPAEVNLNIGVAPSTSLSVDDVIADFDVMLETGQTYVAIANGVLDPGIFAENPDGMNIGFTLYATDNISEQSGSSFWVKVLAFHGSTDAPEVDIYGRGLWRWKFFDDLSYGEFSNYRYLLPKSYTLEVTPADDRYTVVASFEADLSGLGGGAAVVFASGFLNPSANQDGAAFGLFVALPNGTVVALPPSGGMASKAAEADKSNDEGLLPNEFSLAQNYPNPFNPTTVISFSLPVASDVTLRVYNVLGQEVKTLVNENLSAGEHQVTFNANDFGSGVYFYKISAGSFTDTRKMMLVK